MCTLYINGMFAIQQHKGVSPTSHLREPHQWWHY